jgi:anti-anti-sigma factor
VDLRGVGFLDATALRTLLVLRNDARRARRALVLVPGSPTVQRVFTLTRTGGLFDWA